MSKTITISVDEEIDMKLREYAGSRYGKRKGSLRKAYGDAVELLLHNKEQEEINAEAIKMLKNGYGLGKLGKWRFNRTELHER